MTDESKVKITDQTEANNIHCGWDSYFVSMSLVMVPEIYTITSLAIETTVIIIVAIKNWRMACSI